MISDARLLARALGVPYSDSFRALLTGAGGPSGLYRAGAEAMRLPAEHAARLEAWLSFTRRMLAPTKRRPIEGPDGVLAYLGREKSLLACECFWVVMLDSRGRPVGRRQIARGTLTACLVHPREVFAPAIRARAASVVVVHNHPSGDPAPSEEDLQLTDRLREAGELLGIPLVDHIVLGRDGHRSLGGSEESSRVHMAKEKPASYHERVAVHPHTRARGAGSHRMRRGPDPPLAQHGLLQSG
jgi:hypothetical protein